MAWYDTPTGWFDAVFDDFASLSHLLVSVWDVFLNRYDFALGSLGPLLYAVAVPMLLVTLFVGLKHLAKWKYGKAGIAAVIILYVLLVYGLTLRYLEEFGINLSGEASRKGMWGSGESWFVFVVLALTLLSFFFISFYDKIQKASIILQSGLFVGLFAIEWAFMGWEPTNVAWITAIAIFVPWLLITLIGGTLAEA